MIDWGKVAFPLSVLSCYWLLLIRQLGAQWAIFEQYRYGWFVPFLCLYLVWQRAHRTEPSGCVSVRLSALLLSGGCALAVGP
jgi:Transmembrane exosortase (Exosortase_EpsH)